MRWLDVHVYDETMAKDLMTGPVCDYYVIFNKDAGALNTGFESVYCWPERGMRLLRRKPA